MNLAGFTLTISGGGLLNRPGTRQINNGRLTAGDGLGPANLYLRCLGIAAVGAAISDNGAAGPVSLVKMGSSNLNLSGANSYSGATIVQEGTVQFTAEQAMSSASELIVDGSIASFQYQPTAAKKIPKLTLKQRGFITAPVISGTQRTAITLDANDVVLESGATNISFSGNGTIRKVTNGVAELSYDSPDFSGNVVVDQGSFTIEVSSGATATPAAGNPFSVDDRITLAVNGRLANTQPLILNGGTLQGVGTTGDVTNNDATVSPGNSVGVLTVGAFNQGATGILNVELLGGPDHVSDQLRAQTASISGTVNAVLMPDAQMMFGDVFNILIANQIQTSNLHLSTSGFEAFLKVVTLPAGVDAGRMSLQLTVVPEPLSFALMLPGMLFVLRPWRRFRLTSSACTGNAT